VESGVAQFQVYSATKLAGPFAPVAGTATAPTGNSSSYSVSFAASPRLDRLFLKVVASMTNGPNQETGVMKVTF